MVIRLLHDSVIISLNSRHQCVELDIFRLLSRDDMSFILDPVAVVIPDCSIQTFRTVKANNKLRKLGIYRAPSSSCQGRGIGASLEHFDSKLKE